MTIKTESVSFSRYGKSFQEKLAFLILDDRVFADRMMEVLDVGRVREGVCVEKSKARGKT